MLDDRLSSTFAALADPTRRAILQQLLKGDAAVGELAHPHRISTRAISKHIAVLEAAGLVTRARESQRRPSSIRLQPLAEIDSWLLLYREKWNRRFDRLGKSVRDVQRSSSDE